jgi:hypothetical protein
MTQAVVGQVGGQDCDKGSNVEQDSRGTKGRVPHQAPGAAIQYPCTCSIREYEKIVWLIYLSNTGSSVLLACDRQQN